MNKKSKTKKINNNEPKQSFGKTFLKIVFCFLLPYIVINGIIFFLFIQIPEISIIKTDSKDYDETKIKFNIKSILPIIDIKTYFQDEEVPYSKFGEYYIIDANNNGTYQITATSLNKAIVNSFVEIEARDGEAPTIHTDDASIIGDTLTISISDAQSEINYEKIYAIYENGSTVAPSYIDKASGTVQFHIDSKNKLTIHAEDINGNSSEATFDIAN